ncbi:hypothetical protein AX17_003990 [Amanita inopinata Kibby_2008]|nr:hypothetical protein AX17_003990 [Amanita inopinata Kibby_2008]
MASSNSRLHELASRYGIWALIGTRFLLSLIDTSEFLQKDHLLSSPLTSFSILKEGIYLFNHGVNPYSGGFFRHSPLFLSLFTILLPPRTAPLLWASCDVLGAMALVDLWRVRGKVSSSTRDNLVAACYILNPYLLFPSLALSTSSLENVLVLLTLKFASHGKKPLALLCLAFLVQVSFSYIVILLPIAMLLLMGPVSHLACPSPARIPIYTMTLIFGQFVTYFLLLTIASTTICGDWSWIPQTWGASFTLPDLSPNPGLWWYFFTEMFDHFRSFFLMVFSVHILIYVIPICIKFQYDPLYASFNILGALGIFKAYPTLADSGLFISMIAVFPEIYPYLRHPIVTTYLHLHALLLMPLFHSLWLKQGTGNANFFYASTLVFACANGAALIDCIWAGLRLAIGPDQGKYVVIQE